MRNKIIFVVTVSAITIQIYLLGQAFKIIDIGNVKKYEVKFNQISEIKLGEVYKLKDYKRIIIKNGAVVSSRVLPYTNVVLVLIDKDYNEKRLLLDGAFDVGYDNEIAPMFLDGHAKIKTENINVEFRYDEAARKIIAYMKLNK